MHWRGPSADRQLRRPHRRCPIQSLHHSAPHRPPSPFNILLTLEALSLWASLMALLPFSLMRLWTQHAKVLSSRRRNSCLTSVHWLVAANAMHHKWKGFIKRHRLTIAETFANPMCSLLFSLFFEELLRNYPHDSCDFHPCGHVSKYKTLFPLRQWLYDWQM